VQVARLHHGRGSHVGSGNWNGKAMFAVAYQVLLQPLPFPNAQHLYQSIGTEELGKENLAVPYAA
jgi:hypothetical protein